MESLHTHTPLPSHGGVGHHFKALTDAVNTFQLYFPVLPFSELYLKSKYSILNLSIIFYFYHILGILFSYESLI